MKTTIDTNRTWTRTQIREFVTNIKNDYSEKWMDYLYQDYVVNEIVPTDDVVYYINKLTR